MALKEWCAQIKSEAQKMNYGKLMDTIDALEAKVPKNPTEARAIELMLKIYEYELQKRLWEE